MTEVERAIAEQTARLESTFTREIGRLEGALKAHLEDRYAHQPARETFKDSIEDWNKWRSGVDGWRRFIAGGLSVVGLEATGIGIELIQHWPFH